MKKMPLQELGNLVIIVKLSTALLQMLNSVQTGILDLRGKTLLYLSALYISCKHIRSVNATDVLLKRS